MTTMATAAVLRAAARGFEIEQVRLGALRPDEVLVRIVGVGVCHTDLAARDAGFLDRVGPVILGHEGAGVVEVVGPGVSGIEVGDHVVLSFESCGRCRPCRAGQPAYCADFMLRNASGRRADFSAGAEDAQGGSVAARWFGQSSFATHAIATERNAVVVDRSLPLELLGPLGCGLQTGAGSVLNVMRLGPGQSIAVFGAGGVGLAAVMAARAAGAGEIVAVDLHDSRLQISEQLGATRTVRGDTADLAAAVTGGGQGLDFVLDTTGDSAVMAAAVAALGPGGQAVFVGAGLGILEVAPMSLAGKTVTYALEGSAVPHLFIPSLIELWQAGRFPFETFVRTYPLEKIAAAEADSLAGITIKPVLLPSLH
ncbi:alcohol dehydrogenase catalytic domain-containing protein [uncultured Jatrophihabitans sp.]|uniref:alcohol dehydrogenase catalytic domain-containing protein n=1 Tax=uncultured Jatrophihabitans sp. TaxID=1610747 RepID=UPI0035CA966D